MFQTYSTKNAKIGYQADDINAKLRSLQGQDRMDYYPQARQQMEDLFNAARGNLSTANQTIDFDRQVRYLTSRAEREAGDLYDSALKEYGIGVNNSGADLSR